MSDMHALVYDIHSADEIYIDGDFIDFAEGDSQRVVQLSISAGGESLSATFDEYHLTELRRAIQRAERWVKK